MNSVDQALTHRECCDDEQQK